MAEVLIVDDDASLLRLLTRLLKRKGVTTATAATVSAALESLKAASCEVLVSDWRLERSTARELLLFVQTMTPRPVVILTTGDAEAPGGEFSGLVSEVLPKPYDAMQLCARIAANVASRKSSPERAGEEQ